MKYRFDVVHRSKYMKTANEFLKSCDIDIGEIGIRESFAFSSDTDKSIEEIKADIRKAFELCEMELLHIEGGKVE